MNNLGGPKFRVERGIAGLLIALWILVCFAPVFYYDFVNWDDDAHVYDNPAIRSLSADHFKRIFTGRVNDTYIPLTTLSYAFEYSFVGLKPFLYHFDNVLLHILVVLFVFGLGLRWLKNVWAAGLAALIFGIHPLRVESVAWVTERKDMLYAVFYLAAVYVYDDYVNAVKAGSAESFHQKRRLIIVLILGILSLLAKPMAISLPLILLLLDWWKERRWTARVWVEKIPLAAVAVLIGLISYVPHARLPDSVFESGFLIWSWTAVFYLKHFLIPYPLIPIYEVPQPVSWLNPEYGLAVVLAVLLVLSFWLIRSRWYRFALAYYGLSMFFLFRFDALGDTNVVAEHYVYLPSMGLCLLTGYGLQQIDKILFRSSSLYILCFRFLGLIGLIGLSLMTVAQCDVWKNGRSLWSHELKFNTNEPIAYNNLANTYYEELKKEDFFEKYSVEKSSGKGMVRWVSGLYQQAHAIDPGYWQAYFNLGCFYQDTGQYELARMEFEQLLKFNPYDAETSLYLAQVEAKLGLFNYSIISYASSIYGSPVTDGLYVEAVSVFNQAVKDFPREDFYPKVRQAFFLLYRMKIRNSAAADLLYQRIEQISRGNHKKASQILARASTISPAYVQMYLRLLNIIQKPDSGLEEGIEDMIRYAQQWDLSSEELGRSENTTMGGRQGAGLLFFSSGMRKSRY